MMLDSLFSCFSSEVSVLFGLSLLLGLGVMCKNRVLGEGVKLVLVLSTMCVFLSASV